MAFYGMSYPYIAKLDAKTKKYTGGFKNGAAVATDITPNYSETTLYGDDILQEAVKEFNYADINLTTTHMPIAAAEIVFGHEVDSEKDEIIYKSSDKPNYVGYGFCVSERINGVTKYIVAILPKVTFAESAENYTTKGGNMEFKNPSISGKVMPLEDGTWKVKKTFATLEEAVSFIKEYLGIEDDEMAVTE